MPLVVHTLTIKLLFTLGQTFPEKRQRVSADTEREKCHVPAEAAFRRNNENPESRNSLEKLAQIKALRFFTLRLTERRLVRVFNRQTARDMLSEKSVWPKIPMLSQARVIRERGHKKRLSRTSQFVNENLIKQSRCGRTMRILSRS